MRKVFAALVDAVLTALAGYLGFRVGLWAAPCKGHLDDCFILTPLIVLCVVAALGLYFALGYVIFRATLGQRLLRID